MRVSAALASRRKGGWLCCVCDGFLIDAFDDSISVCAEPAQLLSLTFLMGFCLVVLVVRVCLPLRWRRGEARSSRGDALHGDRSNESTIIPNGACCAGEVK